MYDESHEPDIATSQEGNDTSPNKRRKHDGSKPKRPNDGDYQDGNMKKHKHDEGAEDNLEDEDTREMKAAYKKFLQQRGQRWDSLLKGVTEAFENHMKILKEKRETCQIPTTPTAVMREVVTETR